MKGIVAKLKGIELYLKNQGISLTSLTKDEYDKLKELWENWVINNIAAQKSLNQDSYSPYSKDYRYIQFSRLAETNKAMLEDEVIKLKSYQRKREV